jgi:LPS-assembly protein
LNTLTGFSTTGVRRNISPTSLTLRVSPKGGLSCDLRADYDIRLRRLRDTGVWANWQRGKLILAGTYVKTNGLEPSIFTAHHIQGLAGYGSLTEPGFSAGLTLSYNIQTRVLLNSNSRLNYNWNCCGVSMEFQQFDLGLRTESRFTFSFTLKGIGTFGNLKRLESLF